MRQVKRSDPGPFAGLSSEVRWPRFNGGRFGRLPSARALATPVIGWRAFEERLDHHHGLPQTRLLALCGGDHLARFGPCTLQDQAMGGRAMGPAYEYFVCAMSLLYIRLWHRAIPPTRAFPCPRNAEGARGFFPP